MHTASAADAVIFVLLDAFRHDYLSRTRYLQQIASQSVVGRLEEPFGFCPRGAYFGGLSMAEQGYTNLFRFDPENSCFRWTRLLAGTGRDAFVRERLRAEIMAHARAEATPFAASYLDPLDIPLEWLGYFDLCETEGPSSRRVGYRSLFHILEDAGRSWLDVSWPYPGWSGTLSSARVAAVAFERWRREHAFAFIHLPDLDIEGHRSGPGSREIQAALAETDRLCELICARATEFYRDPLLLFIGDHGMLPVARTVNVAQALEDTGLRFGFDVVYFIDSTMVRCWCSTDAARRVACQALARLGGGHILSPVEKDRWGLTGIDARSAEEIFLADPGVLFSPSFFDWAGRAHIRGMHGYAPDVLDNQGVLLAYRPRAPYVGDAGTVEARQLFPTMLRWLGWDPAGFTFVPPMHVKPPADDRVRWSVGGTPAADALVDGHLAHIVDAIRTRTPEVEAVVLAGGFGRGEGTVVGRNGSARPVNDYDVVAIGGDATALDGLGAALARELEMDFVEVWPRPSLSASDMPSQFDYDLRYGSRLLWGDPLVIDRLPRYAPAELSVDEGVVQIGNRSGGLLLGLTGVGPAIDSPDCFLARQAAKFLIAIADCWLITLADYHPSYVVRRQRFRGLSTGTFSRDVVEAIDTAFVQKLDGSTTFSTSADAVVATANAALIELEAALARCATDDSFAAWLAAVAPRHIRRSTEWLEGAARVGLEASEAHGFDGPAYVGAIYRACLEAVRAWPLSEPARVERVASALAPQFRVANRGAHGLATAVARTWLGFFH